MTFCTFKHAYNTDLITFTIIFLLNINVELPDKILTLLLKMIVITAVQLI